MGSSVTYSVQKVEAVHFSLAIDDESLEATIGPDDRDRVAKELHAIAGQIETRHIVKVTWADEALKNALHWFTEYRAGRSPFPDRISDPVAVVIDTLRAVLRESNDDD